MSGEVWKWGGDGNKEVGRVSGESVEVGRGLK